MFLELLGSDIKKYFFFEAGYRGTSLLALWPVVPVLGCLARATAEIS